MKELEFELMLMFEILSDESLLVYIYIMFGVLLYFKVFVELLFVDMLLVGSMYIMFGVLLSFEVYVEMLFVDKLLVEFGGFDFEYLSHIKYMHTIASMAYINANKDPEL